MAAEAAMGATMAIIMMLFMLLFFLLMIGGLILWIFMIIDCAKRKFKNDNDRVLWILLLVFLGLIAAIIYYFAVYRPGKKSKK